MFSFLKRLFGTNEETIEQPKEKRYYPSGTTKDTFSMKVDRNLKGIELEKQGLVDEAVALYEMNVEKGFEGNHPYDRLCVIYRKQGKIKDEIRVLEKAIWVFEKVNPLRPDRDKKLERFKVRLEKAKKLLE